MELKDFMKNYLWQDSLIDHSKLVARLSLRMFYKLKNFFPNLNQFENKEDIKLLEYGALLHDIGVVFEKKMDKGHHKIGRDLIMDNKISGLDEESNLVVANIVRYHRRAHPDINKHKYYKMLNNNLQRKVDVFSGIVRLADALDYNHFNMVDDFELKFDENSRILTLILSVNIMLNIGFKEVLDKKKELLEKTLDIKVQFN